MRTDFSGRSGFRWIQQFTGWGAILALAVGCGPRPVGDTDSAKAEPTAAAAESAAASGPKHPATVYTLVWNDEFDAPALNESEWDYRTSTRWDHATKKPVSICLPRNVSVTNGMLRIQMKVENHEGIPNTAGGIITKTRYKYGYYEVSAKMDAEDRGWHEAFWSAFGGNWPWPKDVKKQRWFEMDAFEHYSGAGRHSFSYGLIEHQPVNRSVSREILTTDIDLGATFNRYGMEYTPDYFAFYFNDVLLHVTDISSVGHADMVLWLSAVSTALGNAKGDGECFFDYLRCYAIDHASPAYGERKVKMLARMRSDEVRVDAGAVSKGTDLWIRAASFVEPGPWTRESDRGATHLADGVLERFPASAVLAGRQGVRGKSPWTNMTARTMVRVPESGTWRVWVRSRDFETNNPAARYFHVAVNETLLEPKMGTHKKEGLEWQLAGTVELAAGPVSIELVDTSGFWARAEGLLLTTDPGYTPQGPGNRENAAHFMDAAAFRSAGGEGD